MQCFLGIGNYQARTQDITDCTVCRNPKIAYHNHIIKTNMKFGSNLPRVHKACEIREFMEVTAEVEQREMLVCTEQLGGSSLGKSEKLYIHTVATLLCTNAVEYRKGNRTA